MNGPPMEIRDYEWCRFRARGHWVICAMPKGHRHHHRGAFRCTCGWFNADVGMYDAANVRTCPVHAQFADRVEAAASSSKE